MRVDQIIPYAKRIGLDYIAISDHNTVKGHIDNPNTDVIPAVEFDVWYKYIFLHLLAYGIDVNVLLKNDSKVLRTIEKLQEIVDKKQ